MVAGDPVACHVSGVAAHRPGSGGDGSVPAPRSARVAGNGRGLRPRGRGFTGWGWHQWATNGHKKGRSWTE
jgi:hypothetical protein